MLFYFLLYISGLKKTTQCNDSKKRHLKTNTVNLSDVTQDSVFVLILTIAMGEGGGGGGGGVTFTICDKTVKLKLTQFVMFLSTFGIVFIFMISLMHTL